MTVATAHLRTHLPDKMALKLARERKTHGFAYLAQYAEQYQLLFDMLPADFVARRIDENCQWLRAYL